MEKKIKSEKEKPRLMCQETFGKATAAKTGEVVVEKKIKSEKEKPRLKCQETLVKQQLRKHVRS